MASGNGQLRIDPTSSNIVGEMNQDSRLDLYWYVYIFKDKMTSGHKKLRWLCHESDS